MKTWKYFNLQPNPDEFIDVSLHFPFISTYRDTYVEREPGESANDRNDRAIRVATAWYERHLNRSTNDNSKMHVVLLTDDKQNLEKARAEGITCSNVTDYINGLKDCPQLQDKLSAKGFSGMDKKAAIYPPHLTVSEIHEGIKSGKLLQGSFQASRENYLEGFASVEGMEKMVRFPIFELFWCFSWAELLFFSLQ